MAPRREAPSIFVSYARSDGKDLAGQIRRRLANDHGFSLWQDLADMEGGKDWWRQITTAIDKSPAAEAADNVRHPSLK